MQFKFKTACMNLVKGRLHDNAYVYNHVRAIIEVCAI